MADDEQFSLCWNNFNSNLSAGFHESLLRGDLVDVTLAAEGQFVKAHRLVLSVCSPYFRKMFTQMPANQHAFVFLKDVSHCALKDLIQFMYCGEVNVKQEALPAFISTAEALQIKGLTDSDPPPAQSPNEPSTPTHQQQVQQITSPRVRQRGSSGRSFKIETVEEASDDHGKTTTTQIVIQAAPQATAIAQPIQQTQHTSAPQQMGSTTSATVVTHKRPAQRSIGSAQHVKRTKNTIDPLEVAESGNHQQITVQTAVVSAEKAQPQSEPEYIDLPIDLPTKSEPDYTDDAGEVEAEHEGNYVEDDSYGELRYDESYFTETEEGAAQPASTPTTNASATTSKALIKQQASFSDTSYEQGADQTNSDAQGGGSLMFIESPWATPCLVLEDYMYNCHSRKNNKEYWRCHNYSKKVQSERCRARCVLENGRVKAISGGAHNHLPHTEKIEKILQRNKMVSHSNSWPRIRLSHRKMSMPMEMVYDSPVDESKLNLNTSTIMLLHDYK